MKTALAAPEDPRRVALLLRVADVLRVVVVRAAVRRATRPRTKRQQP